MEERNWIKVVRHTRHLLYWLRQQRRIIAAAPVLARILRRLYEARLHPQVLARTAETWKAHLSQHPAEKYLWDITLLPDWIEASLNQRSLHAYRQSERRSSPQELETLFQQVEKILSGAPSPS